MKRIFFIGVTIIAFILVASTVETIVSEAINAPVLAGNAMVSDIVEFGKGVRI